MFRAALGLAEQVARVERGRDGASVVERGEPILTLRPSGRTEWAWRWQPTQQCAATACSCAPISPRGDASPRTKHHRNSSSGGGWREWRDHVLFTGVHAAFFVSVTFLWFLLVSFFVRRSPYFPQERITD